MRSRRNERGAALLMSLVVVLVITAVGVAVIRFASREVAGSVAGKKGAALVSCADAARALLMSQWKLLSVTGAPLPPLDVALDGTGTRLRGGHYGQDPTAPAFWDGNNWVDNVQVIQLNPLTVGSYFKAHDITNRIGDQAQPYRIIVHCTQPDGREAEVEFGMQYGL
jgi:hypothetical protein